MPIDSDANSDSDSDSASLDGKGTPGAVARLSQVERQPAGRRLRRERPGTRSITRRRRWIRTTGLVVCVLLLLPAYSLGRAIAVPSTDPVSARAAEWARGHGLGFVITLAEEISYTLHQPRTGGTPDSSILRSQTAAALPRSKPDAAGRREPTVTVPHQPLTTIATPALTGEGLFRAVVSTRVGPAVQLAYLRPDTRHTSYLAAIMVLSQRSVRFVQHPGSSEPGSLGLWKQPDFLTSAQRAGLAATFNLGFKIKDARGGYYAGGHAVGGLRTGAASVVITRDGRLQIGSWNQELRMNPHVVSVRQNLRLLIDRGSIVANTASNSQSEWGATIKGADYVWRSGLGIDRAGDIISVSGPALSVDTLAKLLSRAGAVRAMELDINPAWVSTMWYSHRGSTTVPHKTLPFARPGDRYLQPGSRDFVAVYTRP